MMPAMAIQRHIVVEERTKALTDWAEQCDINREEYTEGAALGVICSGACYQYAKEALGDQAGYLKLGMVNPLPVERIRRFAARFERVVVIEELDGVIENHCKAHGIAVEGKELFALWASCRRRLSPGCSSEKKPSLLRWTKGFPIARRCCAPAALIAGFILC